MKICIVTELDRPGGSIFVMAHDMQDYYRGKKHEVLVHGKQGALPGHFDVVINLVPKLAAGLLTSRRYMPFEKLLNVFTPNVEEFSDGELAGMFATSASGSFWVAHSLFNARNIMQFVKGLFSPGFVVSFEKSFRFVQGGIDAARFKNGTKDRDFLIAPFNRLTDGQKNIKLNSEITKKFLLHNKLHNRKPYVELYLCEAFDKKHGLDLSPYKVMSQPGDRAEYIARAGRCTAFLCTSNYESLGLYYLELLAAGAVGVFLYRDWVTMLLGDYPFVVPKNSLLTSLLWVHQHQDEAREQIAPVVQRLKKQYSLAGFCEGLLAV